MIEGVVNDSLEATVPLLLIASDGTEMPLTALLDTGYNGYLALPPETAQSAGLTATSTRTVKFGDGRSEAQQFYRGEIIWDDETVAIPILATGDEFVVGTALLEDRRLNVIFRVGEQVTIEAAP